MLSCQQSEPFQTGWKKSSRKGVKLPWQGKECQEADGKRENSLHFWSNLIAKAVFPQTTNADMLRKWLPDFPRPQKVQDP